MPDESRVIEQTLRIRARPETVWRYWTEAERMCEWWGTDAVLDPEPGGTCRVDIAPGAVMQGEFVELVPYQRIVFTFGWHPVPGGPDVPPGSTRVEVTLDDDGGDTILTVRHSGIPSNEIGQHEAGWGHFLPRLAEAATRPPRGGDR